MPPIIATAMYVIGILGLFMLDGYGTIRTSKALWLPVIWITVATSKPIYMWLEVSPEHYTDQLEGNPLERAIFTGLLLIGLIVLVRRGRRVLTLLQMNAPIVLFFSYCAMSLIWSDFPDVAFKRWIKSAGDLVMVLIVLTDVDREGAIKRFLAWAGFLLVPISVLLIKYYPDLGRFYTRWTATPIFVGITNDKNMLGVVCLLFGLSSVWQILNALRSRQPLRRNRPLIAQVAILVMTLWLFSKANSMTSVSCFVLGSALLVATGFPALARKRLVVHCLVATVLAGASFALFFDVGGGLVKTLGRDPTLTGRTEIWDEVIKMNENPLLGAGFESFWLGPRLDKLWAEHWWHPNEAHNGYLEVYLNLGWAGLALLAMVILTGYRNAIDMLRRDPEGGRIRLAFFAVGLIYSCTEAGFRTLNPVWFCLILMTITVPRIPEPSAPGDSFRKTLSHERDVPNAEEQAPPPAPIYRAQDPAFNHLQSAVVLT